MTKIALSYSRIFDFDTCPLLFREKHITKTVQFIQNEAMKRGKKIHSALERNVYRALSGQPPVGEKVVLDTHPIIAAFVDRHTHIATEEKNAFDAKWKVRDYFAKDVFFRSVIDLEGRTELTAGVANIIDFKTGQYNSNEEQLKLYNMVALLKYPDIEAATSTLLFVDQKRNSPPVTTVRAQLKSQLHEVEEKSEAIQISVERDDWPAKQNWKCKWCAVENCRYARR
jgi:hypothetical protein